MGTGNEFIVENLKREMYTIQSTTIYRIKCKIRYRLLNPPQGDLGGLQLLTIFAITSKVKT